MRLAAALLVAVACAGCAFPEYEFRSWDAAPTRDAPVVTRDAPAVCTPAPEVCNGRDDNCNGVTDEGTGNGTAEHCGRCGNRCPAGWSCTQQLCCPPSAVACQGRDGRLQCVSLEEDESHCGACGRACNATQLCQLGVCRLRCPGGETLCGGAATYCANLQTEATNCGACGYICALGQQCVTGRCVAM